MKNLNAGKSVKNEIYQIRARSIVGYWESQDDGLITHITKVSAYSNGTGSFTDINGRTIHAGKSRDICY